MRDYSGINLPITIANWELGAVLEEIRPYWNVIPHKIETEFVAAYNAGTDWVITKNDLDLLPDNLWNILKARIESM